MNLSELFFSKLSLVVFVLVFLVLGLYGLPSDFKVEPEYTVGVLTASSILFGFWVLIIEIISRMKNKKAREGYFKTMQPFFFFSFLLLLGSVICTYLAAVNKIPSTSALLFCTASFIINGWFVGTSLFLSD